MTKPSHLGGLTKLKGSLSTSDGRRIDIWELRVPSTADYLSSWASTFRQHYCPDSEIDGLRAGTGFSRAEYLTKLVFPDETVAPGPGIRAGDFAELLVCDYVEYLLGYWVPRGRYVQKASRNESVKGVDILGFRLNPSSSPEPTDTLLAFEVKAQLSGGTYAGRLQSAINDSSKDHFRRAMSLNATKRRLRETGQDSAALVVQRFQNPSDHPYVYRSGAAAVLSDGAYNAASIRKSTAVSGHRNSGNLELIVIRGIELMKLVHWIYAKAANEA